MSLVYPVGSIPRADAFTSGVFGDAFFDNIDMVTNALDNVAARESALSRRDESITNIILQDNTWISDACTTRSLC